MAKESGVGKYNGEKNNNKQTLDRFQRTSVLNPIWQLADYIILCILQKALIFYAVKNNATKKRVKNIYLSPKYIRLHLLESSQVILNNI